MNVLDFYTSSKKREALKELLTLAGQKHRAGLPPNFLEKDIWVTEILRLLYDEKFLGDMSVAFKGGTALSKCWKAIERFSEDIDLSIHWADLAAAEDETKAWKASVQSGNQQQKFRKQQQDRLMVWSGNLVEKLNERFAQYGIDELKAELDLDSKGEKVNIHFPRVTANDSDYQLDYVLLEFGGRNRGRPTKLHEVKCYLSEVDELSVIQCPEANVQAYDADYVLWEKLTALHQFSTQERDPNMNRLARHWYDVDCLLQAGFADPLSSQQAMNDVVEMKAYRWAEKGVDYHLASSGGLKLVPDCDRLTGIAKDHQEAIDGGMFFNTPDGFDVIIERIRKIQDEINASTNKSSSV
ncbi:MAG: nucleotidyl transferase AbiEii/AbiGii toxin family protein [Hahellaceae bacterium]|nr:nucleotidyl transferase AbiEii/AbiGii toxin family protein [Hahellaceae bacterium]MCP5168912.1 nucleotidyl transferase AbiEii/AbiGii toxin family protein [Hahellaceae bacterium]